MNVSSRIQRPGLTQAVLTCYPHVDSFSRVQFDLSNCQREELSKAQTTRRASKPKEDNGLCSTQNSFMIYQIVAFLKKCRRLFKVNVSVKVRVRLFREI